MYSQISGIKFGVYTPEELKKLSVKRITQEFVLDTVNNVVPEGLYDSALGPYEERGMFTLCDLLILFLRCTTCEQGYDHCPGHFGHIELCFHAYNPLFFGLLVRILKAYCFCCHHFRFGSLEVFFFFFRLFLMCEDGKIIIEIKTN
jgi:DNA-directed RNA polymerase I subunit RPA1